MEVFNKLICIVFFIFIGSLFVSARPAIPRGMREKRQSDQRVAELETLLALQKYGPRREWNRHNDLTRHHGFKLIDFDKIGRKKKSLRFSPGAEDFESWILDPPSLDDPRIDQN